MGHVTFSSIGSFSIDFSVRFRPLVIVQPLGYNSTSNDGSNGTLGFLCSCFKPIVASLSAAMFSCVMVESVEKSIVVSSSWWLNTHSSFHLLGLGNGIGVGANLGSLFGSAFGSMVGFLVGS